MDRPQRDIAYLWDMNEAAGNIQEFIKDVPYEKFTSDKILHFAVKRQLEIIGEAARRVSVEFQNDHREIPWHKMIALRNILTHEYGDIRLDRIWLICLENIPELAVELKKLIPPIDDENKEN